MNQSGIEIGINFSGTTGNRFGKNIYTIMISYKSIQRFLVVLQDVQRNVNRARVREIAEYVLKGGNFK